MGVDVCPGGYSAYFPTFHQLSSAAEIFRPDGGGQQRPGIILISFH